MQNLRETIIENHFQQDAIFIKDQVNAIAFFNFDTKSEAMRFVEINSIRFLFDHRTRKT